MKVSAVATVHAPAGEVWSALTDRAVLAATIPGCERLERTGPGSCHMTITASVASVDGSYGCEATVLEQHAPSSFALTVRASGGAGTARASVQMRLAATTDGNTEVHCDADAVIDGAIAAVGQRVLASAARRFVAEFLAAIERHLAGNGLTAAQPASPAAAESWPAESVSAVSQASSAGPVPAPFGGQGFARGVLVGAAIALAGVVVAAVVGRRAR